MNRYFFSLTYGVGILIEEVNSQLTIKFNDGKRTVNLNEAFEIPDDIINNVLFSEFENYFNYEYIKRAKEIIDEGRVGPYYIMGKTLKAKIMGTKEYETSATFSKNNITCKCSCPVGYNCKHAYALVKTFSNDIEKFNEEYISSETQNDIGFDNYLIEYSKSKNLLSRLLIAKKIEDALINSSDLELVNNLNNIDYKCNRNVSFLSVKRIIAFNTDLFNRVKDLESSLLRNRFVKGLIEDYRTITYYITSFKYTLNYELLIEYLFYNNNYNEIINNYLSMNTIPYDYVDIICYAIENIDSLSDKNLEIFDKYVKTTIELDTVIVESIFIKTKNTAYLTAVLERNKKILLSSSIIEYIDKDEAIKYFKLIRCDNRLLNYIKENLYRLLDTDHIILASILATEAKANNSLAIQILKSLPNNYYLLNYVDGKIDYDSIDRDSFFYYFTPKYKVENFSIYKHVHYYVYFNEDVIFDFIVKDDEIYTYSLKNLTKNEFYKIAELVYSELERDSEYRMFIYNYQKEVRNYTINKKKDELSSIIDKHLSTNVSTKTKARIEVSLILNKGFDEVDLELRVGIDKLYVVKDILMFLGDVRYKRTVSYGKNLTLNHDINNFDDLSKKIINLLLMVGASISDYNYSNRSFGLTVDAANEIIRLHKGNRIIIDGKEYNVRLEERKAEYYIDNKYKVRCDLPFDTINIGEVTYLKSEANSLDILKSSNDYNFDQLMQDLKDKDISSVVDKFKEDVYYKYQGVIKIDQAISNEFIINDVRIDAYFDYDDKKIKLETRLFKNDIEIDETRLDKNDKAKVVNYINYLTYLGVHDNVIDDEEYIYLFFTMDFTELRSLCNVYLSDSIKNKSVVNINPPIIRVKYDTSMMNVFVEESDYSDEELYKILKAIKKKKKFILLDDNKIIDINNQEAEDFLDAVEELIGDYENLTKPTQIPFYQAIKAFSHQNNTTIDDYLLSMYYELTSFKKAKFNIPNINGELRQYQKEGFYFLKILSKYNLGGILADDMGLGKTLEIISLISSDEENKPSLVVCPKSLIFNWEMEIRKFAPDLCVIPVVGDQKVRHRIINGIDNEEKQVFITAYDSLRNDIEVYDKINFNYLILDEAQFIKNVSATKSKNVKMLKAMHRFALTGTPIENNIIDLWSIFDFIMPGYLENLSSFKNKFMANKDYEKLVIKKTKLFILRRTKTEVLKDLPEKFERIVSCDMTEGQNKLYEAYKLQARKAMEDGDNQLAVTQYLVRLRQICVDPATFVENYSDGSGKMNELSEIIDQYVFDGHKILIFSSFVKALEIIEKSLQRKCIKYLMLTGDTKLDERNESVRLFNSDKEIKIFLISLKAGGTGLNLVGADTVIHLDPWWNVAAMDQASDRAHRIGQLRNVEVIKLVCNDSIEQRVIELQNMKKDLIDRMISNDDSSITNYDLKDLGYILK